MATATARTDHAGTITTTTTTMNVKELQHQLWQGRLSTHGVKTNLQKRLQVAVDTKVPYFTDAQLKEAQNHKKAATKKKTVTKKMAPNKKKAATKKKTATKKTAPNKKKTTTKKAIPNKKKTTTKKKTAIPIPRSNTLCLLRGKGKESKIPFFSMGRKKL